MKKYGRTIIVIAVLVALGLGYYYYLANKDTGKDATDIAADTGEVSVLISKDIMANYPESPKDVVNLYARITKAYYDTSLTDEQIEAYKKELPELPDARKARLVNEYGLPTYDAEIITSTRAMAEYFDAVVDAGADAKLASNWIMGETMRLMKEESAKTGREFRAEELTFSPESLAKIITLVEKKEINNAAAKEIFEHVFAEMLMLTHMLRSTV